MTAQNLVSVSFTAEGKGSVEEGIASITRGLPGKVSVLPEQKKELVKVGNTYLPFLDLAHEAVSNHPEIMPQVFDVAEFQRDYQLGKDMTPYVSQVRELLESMEDTAFAAYSDAMAGALEIYAAVHASKDKVPGLSVTADQMAAFFKRTRRKTATASPVK